MKLAVVGAGATGGYVGALLARAGEDVTLVARGPHLAAMQAHGVRVHDRGGEWRAAPRCTDDWSTLGDADVCILTLKAHAIPGIAPRLRDCLNPAAVIVPAQNGIPWWYFQKHGGHFEGRRLQCLDPDGTLSACLPAERLLGCVVWPATRLTAPGVIEHVEGNRFTLGELDGERTERASALAAVLTRAGLKSRVSRRIRSEIWTKLLGNVAMNPLSALTRATLIAIATDTHVRPVTRAMMLEAAAVAQSLGIEPDISVDQRLAGAEGVGAHRSSMLQDVESGRPLEVEALIGAVVELGELLGLDLPHLRTVYACVSLLDRTLRGTPA